MSSHNQPVQLGELQTYQINFMALVKLEVYVITTVINTDNNLANYSATDSCRGISNETGK
jgi:hypothetical protein